MKESIRDTEEGLRKYISKRMRVRDQKALKTHTGCAITNFMLVMGDKSFATLTELREGLIMERTHF